MNPTIFSVLEKVDVVVLGSGPAGLAVAYSLIEEGKEILFIDQGANTKNFFTSDSQNSLEQSVGGIGGVAKAWGGQCATFTKHDELLWRTAISSSSWNQLERGIEAIASYIQVPIRRFNMYKSLDKNFQKIIKVDQNFELLHTVYASNLDFDKLFASVLQSKLVHFYEAEVVKIQLENQTILNQIILQSGEILEVKQKQVFLALGTLATTRLISESSLDVFAIQNRVLDHPQAYVMEIIGKLPWRLRKSSYFRSGDNFFKRKIVYTEEFRECTFEIHIDIGSLRKLILNRKTNKLFICQVLHYITNYVGTKIFHRPLTSKCRNLVWIQIDQLPGESNNNVSSITKPTTHWEVDAQDFEFIKRATNNFGELLKSNKVENFRIFSKEEVELTLTHSFHPSSTIELRFEKKGGLANRLGSPNINANFAVVSAAVFPFSGWINPTLIIMGFAYASAKKMVSKL